MKIIGDDAILELDILEKEHPESEDAWDQKWLKINIQGRFEGFRAYFGACLMIDEFDAFIGSISKVLDVQKGIVALHTVEEAIYLRGEVDYTGNIEWTGVLTYPVGIGNKLHFAFKTDFYQLQRIKDNLTREVSNYRSLGGVVNI